MTTAHAIHTIGGINHTWEEFVIEHAVDAILTVDPRGRVLTFNHAAERIFRCPAVEAIGGTLDRFIPERFRAAHASHAEDFLRLSGEPKEMSMRDPVAALRADGEEFFAEISLVPVAMEDGIGAACIARDITERLRVEAAVLQAEKLESLRMLSAGLAHDFNNILTTVLGNADIALQYAEPDTPAQMALVDIRLAGQRAAEMVQQMLRFAGKAEHEMAEIDLNTTVVEMARLLRASVKPTVTPRLDLTPGIPDFPGDETGVRQVVMNLIFNALEAIGDAPATLTVGTSVIRADRRYLRATTAGNAARPGTYAVLTVSDTGPGIDAETRARIFDPFFSTKFAGRGLGLASVLGVVRAHRGAIRISSKPGKGTTFQVLFPLGRSET